MGLGLGVWGLGFGVWGLEFGVGVWGLGVWVGDFKFGIREAGVCGFGFCGLANPRNSLLVEKKTRLTHTTRLRINKDLVEQGRRLIHERAV